MWVFNTPLTHKTTHKNFKVSNDALLLVLGVILAEVGLGGGFFRDREDISDNYVIQMHLCR
jgi:hypothetical protein